MLLEYWNDDAGHMLVPSARAGMALAPIGRCLEILIDNKDVLLARCRLGFAALTSRQVRGRSRGASKRRQGLKCIRRRRDRFASEWYRRFSSRDRRGHESPQFGDICRAELNVGVLDQQSELFWQ